jgi:hypothetical protein
MIILRRPCSDAEAAELERTKLEALVQREAKGAGQITTVGRTGKPCHEISLATVSLDKL